MNKFLWNLFGIKDGDIPEDPSRRGFLKLLGGAAAVGVIQPTHFLAPAGGWPQDRIIHTPLFSSEDFTRMSSLIVPMLTDNVFKPSPLFTRMFKDGESSRLIGA
jgi:hypothetical protein